MKSIVTVHLLVLLGCCAAFPVKPEETNTSPLAIDPIFLQEPTNLGNVVEDNSSPVAYILFLGKLDGPERKFDRVSVEKRNVENEDLEPAAGTYALRPLFVYRQQVAYRQRLRNSRQGNGF